MGSIGPTIHRRPSTRARAGAKNRAARTRATCMTPSRRSAFEGTTAFEGKGARPPPSSRSPGLPVSLCRQRTPRAGDPLGRSGG